MIKRPHQLFMLLLVLLWGSSGAAHAFSSMVVLGDSLSDQGNVYAITSANPLLPLTPPPEYTDGTNVGRFTNGLNYIDYLPASINVDVLPSPSLLGGTNYATGGARTDSASIGGIPIGPFSLLDQRNAYLADVSVSGIDPDALHIVWGGSNDVADIIEQLATDPSFDLVAAVGAVGDAVSNIADIVSSLAANDAKTILVPNVPNLGLVPLITQGGPPVDAASQLSALFNLGLADAMDGIAGLYPETALFGLDVFSLITDAYFNPDFYGLTNVTDGCYSEFVVTGGTTCPNPDEYLSWDGFHPTTAAHQILAANVVVPIPAAVWLFCSGLFSLLLIVRRKR